MANEEHLAILKKGVAAWNEWREQHPDLRPDLVEANLSGANLREANLDWRSSRGVSQRGGSPQGEPPRGEPRRGGSRRGGSLVGASLHENLSRANLSGADLGRADLRRANLSGADLAYANLNGANLSETDLSEALLGLTVFADVDLSTAKGLETGAQGPPPSALIPSIARKAKFPRSSCAARAYLTSSSPTSARSQARSSSTPASSAIRLKTRSSLTGFTPICRTEACAAGLRRTTLKHGSKLHEQIDDGHPST